MLHLLIRIIIIKKKNQRKSIVSIELMKKKCLVCWRNASVVKHRIQKKVLIQWLGNFVLKTLGSGKVVTEIAVFEEITAFNEGISDQLNTLKELGLNPDELACDAAKKFDIERVRTAEKQANFRTLEARRAKHMQEVN